MLWTKKCTWFLSTPISRNLMKSYLSSISWQIFHKCVSTLSLKTERRYFAGHTKWYTSLLTLRLKATYVLNSFCIALPLVIFYHQRKTLRCKQRGKPQGSSDLSEASQSLILANYLYLLLNKPWTFLNHLLLLIWCFCQNLLQNEV